MDPTAAVVVVAALVIVGVAAVSLLRPALGARLWTVGGDVPLHHALSDPDVVRVRLLRRSIALAAPALIGGPYLLIAAVAAAITTVFDVYVLAMFAVGAAITAAGFGGLWATWRVRHHRKVGAVAVSGIMRLTVVLATLTVAIAAVYMFWAGGAGQALVWAGLPAVWALGTVSLANEVRIVATWDRLCQARHAYV